MYKLKLGKNREKGTCQKGEKTLYKQSAILYLCHGKRFNFLNFSRHLDVK